jgi:hypothetical protein
VRDSLFLFDDDNNAQEKFALVITPYATKLVLSTLAEKGRALMGASRDNPPPNSLGDVLKRRGITPQLLSYLVPVLIEAGFCTSGKSGRAFVLYSKKGG